MDDIQHEIVNLEKELRALKGFQKPPTLVEAFTMQFERAEKMHAVFHIFSRVTFDGYEFPIFTINSSTPYQAIIRTPNILTTELHVYFFGNLNSNFTISSSDEFWFQEWLDE